MLDIKAPHEIETNSMRIIESEAQKPFPFKGIEWKVARRMVHTSADFDLLNLIRFHPDAVQVGVELLKKQAVIVTDTQMARCGIPMRRMKPLGCRVDCLMSEQRTAEIASRKKITRARAAIDLAFAEIKPDIFVIGNAPTALIRLLELIKPGSYQPKLVIGMPVGFVNAAESKELLLAQQDLPYVTIEGRKGGSALAACVINQLADEALAER